MRADADDAASDDSRADLPGDTPVTTDAGTDGAPGDTTNGDASGDRNDAAADVPPPTCVTQPSLCSGSTPVCDTTNARCVGCVRSEQCSTTAAPVCDTTAKKCVQCVQSSDCKNPYQPVCQNQLCRGCLLDSECTSVGPGVCLSPLDGHCATDDETVYVKNVGTSACHDDCATAGTRELPFCQSQAAIVAALTPPLPPGDGGAPDAGATPDGGVTQDGGGADAGACNAAVPTYSRTHTLKTLVVMSGPNTLNEVSFAGGTRTLTIVGKGATIGPNHDGITVTSGTLYARDLTVTTGNGTFTGVAATGGTIYLDRMVIKGNRAGGVLLDNAAFSITNSIIAQNGSAVFTGPVTWAGILVNAIPASGPAVVVNDTIADNAAGGVVCTGIPRNRARLAGLLFSGNPPTNGDLVGTACVETPCCLGANNTRIDPAFVDRVSYRLQSTSACLNTVDQALSTAYDIDGQPRPNGSMSDCGADEFYP